MHGRKWPASMHGSEQGRVVGLGGEWQTTVAVDKEAPAQTEKSALRNRSRIETQRQTGCSAR